MAQQNFLTRFPVNKKEPRFLGFSSVIGPMAGLEFI